MIKVNNSKVAFNHFPNGETKIVESSIELNKKENEIYFKYESNEDLIRLLFLKNLMDDLQVANSVLYIYYMPYSRMDRSENKSAFTLKYITNFINSMQFNRVHVVEPHSNVTTALLDRCTPYFVTEHLIDEVMLMTGMSTKDDFIMYPDAGAASRYKNLKYPNVLIGNKERNFESGKIQRLELIGSLKAKGNKVLILDDLTSYGNTFILAAKALREVCFAEIYLLVAHAENSVYKGNLFEHIDKLFTTDSILSEQDHWHNATYKDRVHIFNLESQIQNHLKIGDCLI